MTKAKEIQRIIMKPSWIDTLNSFSVGEKRSFSNKELRVDVMRKYCSKRKRVGMIFEVNENSSEDNYIVTRKA